MVNNILFSAALVGVSASSQVGGGPSDWYYKSWHACTNSDGRDVRKCPATAKSWACSGDITTLYCAEEDKQSCADMGVDVSAAEPDGFGFMCPSFMLGTSEMVAAAKNDGYDGAYGVVTIDALSCGQCVEILNDDPQTYPNAPKITAQIFNSVAASVDVYMVGGGLGANNGCSSVAGYSPMASMYNKYPTAANREFVEHLVSIGYPDAASQIDSAIQYAGGLRGGKTYAECVRSGKSPQECQPAGNGCDGGGGMCITNATAACPLAFEGTSDFVTQKAMESCLYVFDHDLHWNRPISYTVVDCPASLTALTGLVPASTDDSLKGVWAKTNTTTMEDCCEPTCSRVPEVKGSWKSGFDAIYTCNAVGETYTEAKNPIPNPCHEGPSPPAPPTPPSPPAPPSPPSPLKEKCCYGGCGAHAQSCQGGWCGESQANCEGSCKGTWCPGEVFVV
jgi:hypothetical protein